MATKKAKRTLQARRAQQAKRTQQTTRTRIARKARTSTARGAATTRKAARRASPKPAAARATAGIAHDLKAEQARLARNKQLVLAMYQKLIGEKDYEAARPFMGDTYRQHAPYAADGHEGISAFVRGFKQAFPLHRYDVKKVVAEGDLVVLHLHGINGPNPHGESVVDIFRIENGKVVEHWDVIQAIPEKADNANTMF
jgi:predicted SnoaL-like aldol condensation-catalyzing enzyme